MFDELDPKKRKKLSPKEAKLKAADFCVYQERSQQQVRDKLYEYGLYTEAVEEILSELITENFINEERFAIAYAGGKFRMKKWGRLKIIQGLKQHKISDYCLKKGLAEIDEADYNNVLVELIKKRIAVTKAPNTYVLKNKVASYLLQRGFESNLVWEELQHFNL